MTSKRKFYRTLFTFEVMSEDPIETVSLEDLAYLVTEGGCSGRFLSTEEEEVGGRTAAQILIDQGSDPGFFRLDEEGNDAE